MTNRLLTLQERKARIEGFGKRFWRGFALSVGIGLVIAVTLLCLAVKSLESIIRALN